MKDDLFCKIIEGKIPSYKIYEDEKTFAFLDINPVTKGHALVIPKNYAENLSEGSVEDAEALMRTVHMLGPIMMKALGAAGYNLGMNHGEVAGQEVFHTHLHIMPRYEGKSRTFEKYKASKEELEEVMSAIQAAQK